MEYPPLSKFLEMSDDEVASLVSATPLGRVGVLVPDGNRKAGLVLWGFDPSKRDFDKSLFSKIYIKFLKVLKSFFESGVRILFVPTVTHGNFERGKQYMDAALEGFSHIFHDPSWREFYKDLDLRVRFYGDNEYILKKGYPELVKWMDGLEEETKDNKGPLLFYGIACTRGPEEVRLASLGIKIFKEKGTDPSRKDLIKEYYGMDLPEIGFFIRPTEVRDSDIQPVLLSGLKTQLYFPVGPMVLLSKRIIRCILYDAIVNRVASGGRKIYSKSDIDTTDMMKVREFFIENQCSVQGLGIREGPFWLPCTNIKIPRGMERIYEKNFQMANIITDEISSSDEATEND